MAIDIYTGRYIENHRIGLGMLAECGGRSYIVPLTEPKEEIKDEFEVFEESIYYIGFQD